MEKVENIFVEIVLKLTPDCKSQKTGKKILESKAAGRSTSWLGEWITKLMKLHFAVAIIDRLEKAKKVC